jgi:branched-chain amino acid transport system substrate-binding protein
MVENAAASTSGGAASAPGGTCYEKAKDVGPDGPTLIHPLSTAMTYSLIDRASADRIPLVSVGYGRPDAADGRIFPYVFPLISTYWDQAAAMVRYIGERAGSMGKLRGKRIVLLYQDSAYGKEAIPVLSALATTYGYLLSTVAVTSPGDEQQEQWQRIRSIRPDWVILWGRGEMNPAALKYAARQRFPRSRVLGVWWSGSEAEVTPAGAAARGFVAAAFNAPGDDFPVIREIRRLLYSDGGGELRDVARIGSVYYNRGVVYGILTAEAVRLAQEHFGVGKPVTGEQVRWGLEHLRLDEARLAALGAKGLMPPVETSCADHAGSGLVRFIRWNGKRWEFASDWMTATPEDRAAVRRMALESANAYAKGKGLKPRTCPGD